MQRFQLDKPVMIKRWRKEWIAHGRNFGDCHCGAGMGTMRKHRPFESHPSSSCGICATERLMRKADRRRERYGRQRDIAAWLADL